MKQGTGGTGGEREEGEKELGVGYEGGWLCVSRGPPCELCSREPGRWGEVVRACLKQYTQGFSQSSHTQCARSMSFSQRSPAVTQHIQSNPEILTLQTSPSCTLYTVVHISPYTYILTCNFCVCMYTIYLCGYTYIDILRAMS